MCVKSGNNSENKVEEKCILKVHHEFVFHAGNHKEQDGAEPFNNVEQSQKEKSPAVNTRVSSSTCFNSSGVNSTLFTLNKAEFVFFRVGIHVGGTEGKSELQNVVKAKEKGESNPASVKELNTFLN